VELKNFSSKAYKVNPGDRIAQLVVLPVVEVEITVVADVRQTTRGGGGFGSTGS